MGVDSLLVDVRQSRKKAKRLLPVLIPPALLFSLHSLLFRPPLGLFSTAPRLDSSCALDPLDAAWSL